jgi:hypothetical protein
VLLLFLYILTHMNYLQTVDAAVLQAAELFKLDYVPAQKLDLLHYWMDDQRLEEDEKLKGVPDHEKENTPGSFLRGLEAATWNDGPDLITLYDYKGLQDPAPTWLTSTVESLSSYLMSRGKKVSSALRPLVHLLRWELKSCSNNRGTLNAALFYRPSIARGWTVWALSSRLSCRRSCRSSRSWPYTLCRIR